MNWGPRSEPGVRFLKATEELMMEGAQGPGNFSRGLGVLYRLTVEQDCMDLDQCLDG